MDIPSASSAGEGQVMRFSVTPLSGLLFVRRPISHLPADGTLGFVDDGTSSGWQRRPVVAVFKDGVWTKSGGKPLSFEPTYWTELDHLDGR